MKLAQWFVPSGLGPFHVSVTPLVCSRDGTFQEGSSSTLTGVIDEIDFRYRNKLENVAPLDRRSAHYVVVETEAIVRLVEILKRKGVNFLASLCSHSDYVRVTVTRGEQTWSFSGIIGEYEECIRKEKCVGILTVHQADVGAKNPEYSG
jgi:hypothetical protein